MKLSNDFIEKLKSHIENGLVASTRHPSLPLFILCYTKEAQYSRIWDEVTVRCRGMVIDRDYNIITQTMSKFFNDTELEGLGIQIPNLPFTIHEKMDGSLIHLWNYKGNWFTSSKGAFHSEQAIKAKSMLMLRYSLDELNPEYTYILEILYPENKIVVDYGDRQDLVLLDILDSEGNSVMDYSKLTEGKYEQFNLPKMYNDCNISELREKYGHLKGTEHEGFVIRYSNGFRMKVKLDNYLILHKIWSNYSPLTFHAQVDLKTLKINPEFLSELPEEFQETTSKIVNSLESPMLAEWDRIENLAKICPVFENNKERFLYLNEHFPLDKHQIVTYLYGKYDEVRKMIWKKFRPTGNVLIG